MSSYQAGGHKMAGKKGQVVQLQLEVNTEEEWKKLLRRARNCRILHMPME